MVLGIVAVATLVSALALSRPVRSRLGSHQTAPTEDPSELNNRAAVITIHGVCPDREWQAVAHRVFTPHFRCDALQYRDYDCTRGGAVKAVVSVPLLLLAIALVLEGEHWLSRTIANVSAAAAFLAGLLLACYQRDRCATRVKALIDQASGGASRVHLVAHSFGTYLAARSLELLSVHRIVLVGCILPRGYRWTRALAQNGDAFSCIRNEVGRRDWVVFFAWLTGWLSRELGGAGVFGFSVDPALVHNVDNAWSTCPACTPNDHPRVHNVPLPPFKHSDAFLGVGHALKQWLPFFWGYEPAEYKQWLEVCGDAAYYLQEEDKVRFQIAIDDLASSTWSWTRDASGDRTLAEHVDAVVREQAVRSEPDDLVGEMVDEALTLIANIVQSARQEVYKVDGSPRVRRFLQPHHAVSHAASTALKNKKMP